MKSRPTIALACILKNESHNIGPFLDSIRDCFDEIYMTDTGSTDNSVDILLSNKAKEVAGCPINVNSFEWCHDFSKARQFCFDQVGSHIDFIMWLDLDDCLGNRDAFIHFRDHTMHCCDMWLAPYNYSFDNGNPTCVFLRERIVRRSSNFKWHFFLHEGLVADQNKKIRAQSINCWTVDHRRTPDDLKRDGGRNLKIFEANIKQDEPLHPRMKYYYGKELYDGSRHLESIEVLREVITKDGLVLEAHDRLMAVQYLSMAYAACEKWAESLQMALQGLQLHPERAEFWILAGDANLKMNRMVQAIPFYEGAKYCAPSAMNGMTFTDPSARTVYPSKQLIQIFHATGNIQAIKHESNQLMKFDKAAGEQALRNAEEMEILARGPQAQDLVETNDVVITCPPEFAITDWDENSIKVKGIGGSETACIEIAKFIKLKTGRPVKVFQPRRQAEIMESGVEYIPTSKIREYLFKYKPHTHIAWRHTARLTPAKTYVWSHDLLTQGGEDPSKYDKYIVLSGFHREFTKDLMRIPDDKMVQLSNGIDPSHFIDKLEKIPNKIIFSSSPDRGLERCIEIVKRVKDEFPDAELHVFYGFENMKNGGLREEAERLEKMIKDHDFVKYHGFVTKLELAKHFKESVVWLYPADFIETFCISAIEALASQTYPLVRNIGSLPYTMKEAIEKGMCTVLDSNASSDSEYDVWARELKVILKQKLWEKIDISPYNYSWEKAAEGFIQEMGL